MSYEVEGQEDIPRNPVTWSQYGPDIFFNQEQKNIFEKLEEILTAIQAGGGGSPVAFPTAGKMEVAANGINNSAVEFSAGELVISADPDFVLTWPEGLTMNISTGGGNTDIDIPVTRDLIVFQFPYIEGNLHRVNSLNLTDFDAVDPVQAVLTFWSVT